MSIGTGPTGISLESVVATLGADPVKAIKDQFKIEPGMCCQQIADAVMRAASMGNRFLVGSDQRLTAALITLVVDCQATAKVPGARDLLMAPIERVKNLSQISANGISETDQANLNAQFANLLEGADKLSAAASHHSIAVDLLDRVGRPAEAANAARLQAVVLTADRNFRDAWRAAERAGFLAEKAIGAAPEQPSPLDSSNPYFQSRWQLYAAIATKGMICDHQALGPNSDGRQRNESMKEARKWFDAAKAKLIELTSEGQREAVLLLRSGDGERWIQAIRPGGWERMHTLTYAVLREDRVLMQQVEHDSMVAAKFALTVLKSPAHAAVQSAIAAMAQVAQAPDNLETQRGFRVAMEEVSKYGNQLQLKELEVRFQWMMGRLGVA